MSCTYLLGVILVGCAFVLGVGLFFGALVGESCVAHVLWFLLLWRLFLVQDVRPTDWLLRALHFGKKAAL